MSATKIFLNSPQPTRYVPLYGGWDAWSMVTGQRETPDPMSFLIRDGHLLLQPWLARRADVGVVGRVTDNGAVLGQISRSSVLRRILNET